MLLLPATIALLAGWGFAIQLAYAGVEEPSDWSVKLVATDDPTHDLSETPLRLLIGQTASFDLLIQLPRDHEIDGDTDLGVPNVYAAQAHFDIHGDVDAVNAVDGDPNTPGFQAILDDERLAFEGKEALRTTPPINEDTAQYWAVLNEFYSDSGNEATGDLFVTELGSPDPNDPGHRIMPLVGDDNGRIFLARFTIIGQEEGTINIDLSDVILVPAEGLLDPVLPEVDVSGGTIVVEQPNQVLVADLVLQGIQRPDPAGWVGDDPFNPVPITFKFYHPDEDVENRFGDAQPALERECNPMIKIENEGFGTCVIRNLGLNLGDSSTWDVAATGPHTLTNLRLGVTVSVGLNPADMGTLLEGDVNQDGGVFIGDVGPLVGSFFETCGDPNYNPNADLDNDCGVFLSDVGLLVGNFFIESPNVVP